MRLAVTLALLVLTLAGCGTAVPSGSPAPTSTPQPSSTPTPPTPPPGSPAPSSSVVVDPSLLDHLPAQVDGLDVTRQPESDVAAARDPAVLQYGEAVITGLVIDPATSEFAYAALVRLRPGVFEDGLFRQWRETFDEGACSLAGGVSGNAVARIDGRDVHIGSCEGGMLTYHVWLGNSRVLVSVSAVGERRLGERLVEGLTD